MSTTGNLCYRVLRGHYRLPVFPPSRLPGIGLYAQCGAKLIEFTVCSLRSIFDRTFMVQKKDIKKIVVIGPEGTGKSTLCEQLADHYQTMWCQEFAREYLLTHGITYTYDDLLLIAKEQVALEEEYLLSIVNGQWSIANPLLFIDTDMYVMKVWCEFVFDKCHRFILDTIVERQYDLYLLCDTDLPWVKDELREYPDLATRQRLYNIYEDLMINQTVPWAKINGNYDNRLKQAITSVNKIL